MKRITFFVLIPLLLMGVQAHASTWR